MNKIIKMKDFQKKEKNKLTEGNPLCYSEILKTNGDNRPRQSGDFFTPDLRGMRTGNILNTSQRPLAFSESPTFSFLRWNLKTNGVKMKINNQEIRQEYKNELSTLQMLWKQYMELKVNWYKGQYTSEQESVFGAVHTALLNALITLPIIVPADKQVKLNLLRDITAFNCENSEGDYDLDNATGCEAEAFNLIDQLLAA